MKSQHKLVIAGALAVSFAMLAAALVVSFTRSDEHPDCTYSNAWPEAMAYGQLMDAKLIDRDLLDFDKISSVRLVSEKIGKDPTFNKDLYRQVHRIVFVKRSGETLTVITVHNASHVECSMSDVDVYVVSRRLGGGGLSPPFPSQ